MSATSWNGLVDKLSEFVRSNPLFKSACHDAFAAADYKCQGKISYHQAIACVDKLFAFLEQPLAQWGIRLERLSRDEVGKLLQATDRNSDSFLDEREFEEFYGKVTIYAGMKAATGLTKKYGTGMLLGLAGVMMAKRTIRSIPILGSITSPLLGLVPSLLLGPALGFAVVYGMDHGDLWALKKRLFPDGSKPMTK